MGKILAKGNWGKGRGVFRWLWPESTGWKELDDFSLDVRSYIERMRRWGKAWSAKAGGSKVAILVTPWQNTGVPFFSVECGRLLAERGLQPVIFWDMTRLPGMLRGEKEEKSLEDLVGEVRRWMPVVEVEGEEMIEGSILGEEEAFDVQQIFYENMVRRSGGEMAADFLWQQEGGDVTKWEAHFGRVCRLLTREGIERVLVPGGIWGLAGNYLAAGKKMGLGVTTYDCGEGALFIDHTGVAAHFGDLKEGWKFLKERMKDGGVDIERAVEMARSSLETRIRGADPYRIQLYSREETGQVGADLLIALNLRMDSASMLRNGIFGSMKEWLEAIWRWMEGRPEVTAILRQHPCERLEGYRGSDSWEAMLEGRPELQERVRYIRAEDPVNTYALVEQCKVVLPYSSRIGIESVLLGRPVVVAAQNYYDETDFVNRASSPDDFQKVLEQCYLGQREVTDEQKESASLMSVLIEHGAIFETDFLPLRGGYRRWVKQSPEELWESSVMQKIGSCLAERIPAWALILGKDFLDKSGGRELERN